MVVSGWGAAEEEKRGEGVEAKRREERRREEGGKRGGCARSQLGNRVPTQFKKIGSVVSSVMTYVSRL